jgi:hypothetical protein
VCEFQLDFLDCFFGRSTEYLAPGWSTSSVTSLCVLILPLPSPSVLHFLPSLSAQPLYSTVDVEVLGPVMVPDDFSPVHLT